MQFVAYIGLAKYNSLLAYFMLVALCNVCALNSCERTSCKAYRCNFFKVFWTDFRSHQNFLYFIYVVFFVSLGF